MPYLIQMPDGYLPRGYPAGTGAIYPDGAVQYCTTWRSFVYQGTMG
jgi:hypothetical protein